MATEHGISSHQPKAFGEDAKDSVFIASKEVEAEDRETRPAHHIHWTSALFDVIVAILPVYSIAFAIAAYLRDDTLADSFQSMAILRMSRFNPTIFPILFTLILAKFIKAMTNYKLERGTTVGQIQLLLGGRSLVASVMTPLKLKTVSYLVPMLVMVWILNPVGGQLSLRVVSSETNTTFVDTSFVYMNPSLRMDPRLANIRDNSARRIVNEAKAVDMALNSALLSPVESKNGTQDNYGNIQIPMLEALLDNPYQMPDQNGYYHTGPWNFTGAAAALAKLVRLPERPRPLLASIIGIPFKPNSSSLTHAATARDDAYAFGPGVVTTRSLFTIESSYMYTDCRFEPLKPDTTFVASYVGGESPIEQGTRSNWPNSTIGIASNKQGFSIAYDGRHTENSTVPRKIEVQSWLVSGGGAAISEASCNLTTTYVEAQIYCQSQSNCTVTRIRPSRAPQTPAYLSVLDGTSFRRTISDHEYATDEDWPTTYKRNVDKAFFQAFVVATGNFTQGDNELTPLEWYFSRPDEPWRASLDSLSAPPLVEVGDKLFSRRFSQLLNTYWLNSIQPFNVINGIDLDQEEAVVNGTWVSRAEPLSNTNGQLMVDRTVLRCHIPYMVVVLLVSLGLFALGLVTAYLDAVRRGPDVLDDFVNSLRHSPYVHIDQGPSMEDGQEKARRLREIVVQMGDVRPDQPLGYVAIGTPNEHQPVERLDHKRHYV